MQRSAGCVSLHATDARAAKGPLLPQLARTSVRRCVQVYVRSVRSLAGD